MMKTFQRIEWDLTKYLLLWICLWTIKYVIFLGLITLLWRVAKVPNLEWYRVLGSAIVLVGFGEYYRWLFINRGGGYFENPKDR